jgi:hypothetical protein
MKLTNRENIGNTIFDNYYQQHDLENQSKQTKIKYNLSMSN